MIVTEKVIKLESTKGSFAYLLRTNEGNVLIDTSISTNGKTMLKELHTLGITALKYILITHHDIDHIGNMSMLQRTFNCPVYINTLEVPYIMGEKKRTGFKDILSRILKPDISATLSPLEDLHISDIKIIHTPGHTPGHTCFIFDGCLFSGDLFRILHLKIIPSRKHMNWDTYKLKLSNHMILQESFKWICPAHYEPALRDEVDTPPLF